MPVDPQPNLDSRMNFSHSRRFFFVLLLTLCTVTTTIHALPNSELLGGPASTTWGQKVWSSENGLPQNSVHQALQTRDGYLWIATEGGVARFNGVQFTVFNQESEPAFTSNDTCCLAEDRTGGLWIGTSDGLLRYAGGAFRRYTTADGLPSAVVLSLAPTDDGFLLVLTSGGSRSLTGRSSLRWRSQPLHSASGQITMYGLRLRLGFTPTTSNISARYLSPVSQRNQSKDSAHFMMALNGSGRALLSCCGIKAVLEPGMLVESYQEHVCSRSSQIRVEPSGSVPIRV